LAVIVKVAMSPVAYEALSHEALNEAAPAETVALIAADLIVVPTAFTYLSMYVPAPLSELAGIVIVATP
jgi:hypothetical protein